MNPQQPRQNLPNNTPAPTANANVTPIAPSTDTVMPDSPSSTQTTLLISELRDSMVIMKDGSFRAVVACKSINFDLMSETEREAIEYSYQGFLNSLNFTVQILIRSQRVDIGPYLERLTDIRQNTDNMLLGVLMDDYINFIDILSQEANIMDKSFFIVIPYYSSDEAEKASTQNELVEHTTKLDQSKQNRSEWNQNLRDLENKKVKIQQQQQAQFKLQAKLQAQIEKFKELIDNHLNYLNENYQLSYEAASQQAQTDLAISEVSSRVKELRKAIDNLGPINLAVIEDFENLHERYSYLLEQHEDLLTAMGQLQDTMDAMDA